ncbi:MAG TPA: porin family protein [Thermoanaerobaculia bacterium]|nr:porin family protein [Thermoanaerobaculia bacterium]
MTRRIHRLSMTFAAALFSLVAASSALAQSEERGATLELFGSRIQQIEGPKFHNESYGLRGGFRFSETWALEASVSRLDEDVDVWFGDLSAKAYVVDTSHFDLYALGGPGVNRISDGDFDEDETTVHFGIGAEIHLGQQAYLRPEVRGRWLTDDLEFDRGLADYSLGIGWRF